MCQLGALRGAKGHDALAQRIIDREDKRLSIDDDGYPTEVMPLEELQAENPTIAAADKANPAIALRISTSNQEKTSANVSLRATQTRCKRGPLRV